MRDCDIAAKEQGMVEMRIPNLWVDPKTFQMKTWTRKGFKRLGIMDKTKFEEFKIEEESSYCSCPYPRDKNYGPYTYCDKCGKTLLK
jgi:hypothetical protein